MSKFSRTFWSLACGLTAGCIALPASALDATGYFRSGPGLNSKNQARQCYSLGGVAGITYRLGNECDIYGEIDFTQELKVDGATAKLHFSPGLWNGGTDTGTAKVDLYELYGSIKGLEFAPEASFWGGKRGYINRQGVHIVDTWFWNPGGIGVGVEELAAGPGKISAAFFRTDGDGTTGSSRLTLEYGGLNVNPDGTLRFNATFTKGQFDGATNGAALTARHTQKKLFGIDFTNDLFVQAAQGSANVNGNFGNGTDGSDVKSWRIVESPSWQAGAFGGQAILMYGKNGTKTGDVTYSTVGGRVSYAVHKNVKLLAEAGLSVKRPEGGDSQRLTKITLGPALSLGPDFWSRPELRLYVTHASWNDAASADTSNNLKAGKTSGTSAGAQLEVWF
ncbi:MAG: carbohydrate porin [Burkholderiaceae bacterium]